MHRRCLAPVHWLAISLVLMAAPLAGLNPAAIDAQSALKKQWACFEF